MTTNAEPEEPANGMYLAPCSHLPYDPADGPIVIEWELIEVVPRDDDR